MAACFICVVASNMRRTWPHARVLALSEDCVHQSVRAPSTAAAVVYAWHLPDDNCERTAVERTGEAVERGGCSVSVTSGCTR